MFELQDHQVPNRIAVWSSVQAERLFWATNCAATSIRARGLRGEHYALVHFAQGNVEFRIVQRKDLLKSLPDTALTSLRRALEQNDAGAVDQNLPRGYSQAAEADDRRVSHYGETNISEDFAEFYEVHLNAEQAEAEALARFEQLYPDRFELLSELVFNQFS